MRMVIILLLLFLPTLVFANTFVVISNADSGPGSLRDAFQQASNNGTAVRDSIIFNLPADVPGRTIYLTGTLVFSSNLVVNGSSEPAARFGVSDAKIIITAAGACWAAFNLYQVTDVAIYGLWITGFHEINYPFGFCRGGCHVHYQMPKLYIGQAGQRQYTQLQ